MQFGDTPQLRVLDFFIEFRFFDSGFEPYISFMNTPYFVTF